MDRSAYRRYFELERSHFWRIAKRRLVLNWLGRHAPAGASLRVLDIGGACSVIPKDLDRWGRVEVLEGDEDTVRLARAQLGIDVHHAWFPDRIPVQGPYDVITMVDVLEHMPDDVRSLRHARDLLRPGGVLLCTVPALKWLWSDHDVALHHYRRYTRRGLLHALGSAGLRVERISYYTSLLLPALALQRLASRLVRRRTGESPQYDVRPPGFGLNRLFGRLMSIERWWLGFSTLPLGSSLIVVCRRQD